MSSNAGEIRENARRLHALRVALGMTQRELAHEFGVTSTAIALWEGGDRAMPGPALRLLEMYERELEPIRSKSPSPFRSASKRKDAKSRGASEVSAVLWLGLSRILVNAEPDSVGSRARIFAIRRYANVIGELKGLSMKIGQMMSYMDFVMPDAEREALASIPATAAPMSAAAVASIIDEELGHVPMELFRTWNARPNAIGSIGQVHEATTHEGVHVAVKVQHRRIADGIMSDIANVRAMDRIYSLLFRGQKPGVFHEEMAARLIEECDYEKEAENVRTFRGIFAGRSEFVIPKVIEELSTPRVLTCEFVDLDSLASFASRATEEERSRAGESLFRFYWESCLRHGIYHTDPNPDNFRFANDRIAILDFGRVKRFSEGFVPLWKKLLRSIFERDRVAMMDAFAAMGTIAVPERFDVEVGFKSLACCFLPGLVDYPFRFTKEFVRQAWRAYLVDNTNLPLIHFTADMVFLHQIQFGLAALLTRMDARVACRPILLDLLYAPDEARPAPFSEAELRLIAH